MVRQHNGLAAGWSGTIWCVNFRTGELVDCVATYAMTQPSLEVRERTGMAYLRVGHGKLSHAEAQQFIDKMGEGF